MTTTHQDLYDAALDADRAFQAELVRVYGSSAGTARYSLQPYSDPDLTAARLAFRAASQRLRDYWDEQRAT